MVPNHRFGLVRDTEYGVDCFLISRVQRCNFVDEPIARQGNQSVPGFGLRRTHHQENRTTITLGKFFDGQ